MNIDALRVFNELHTLGISDEEFKELSDEQSHEERTGLYIQCVKKGHAICVSHDEKHSIIIKDIAREDLPTPSRILFKTLITFNDLPSEVYRLHNIAQYRSLDTDIKNVANTLDELKDKLVNRFIDKNYELGLIYDDGCISWDKRESVKKQKGNLVQEQLRDLFWLFSEDYEKFTRTAKSPRPNIARVIKVFERSNKRTAIIQRNDDYNQKRGGGMGGSWLEHVQGTKIYIRSFTPKNKEYNYVDKDREIYIPSEYYDKLEVWLDDDLFEKCEHEELKVISKRYGEKEDKNKFILLNADAYNTGQTAVRLAVMSAKREAMEEKAKDKLVNELESQFKQGKVIRQGITMTKNSLEYEDLKVSNNKLGEFIATRQVHLLQEPDFNNIVKDFFYWILRIEVHDNWTTHGHPEYTCTFSGREEIRINEVSIILESKNNFIMINNHRINKDDLRFVLLNAISYKTQESFDDYLKYCSTTNLQLQGALDKGGVSFTLKIDNTPDNSLSRKEKDMLLALPLKKVKGKVYTSINGVEYKVKDTKALFDLGKDIDSSRIGMSGGGYLQRTIKLLYRAIEGVTPREIGGVIKNGVKELEKMNARILKEEKEKETKSKLLVRHAVKVSKAKRINGGYLVKGLSGKYYTVADNLATYEVSGERKQVSNSNGRYVCIVDLETDTSTKWGTNDALAKRLLLLAHDEKVSREVHTLHLNKGDEDLEEVEV